MAQHPKADGHKCCGDSTCVWSSRANTCFSRQTSNTMLPHSTHSIPQKVWFYTCFVKILLAAIFQSSVFKWVLKNAHLTLKLIYECEEGLKVTSTTEEHFDISNLKICSSVSEITLGSTSQSNNSLRVCWAMNFEFSISVATYITFFLFCQVVGATCI